MVIGLSYLMANTRETKHIRISTRIVRPPMASPTVVATLVERKPLPPHALLAPRPHEHICWAPVQLFSAATESGNGKGRKSKEEESGGEELKVQSSRRTVDSTKTREQTYGTDVRAKRWIGRPMESAYR